MIRKLTRRQDENEYKRGGRNSLHQSQPVISGSRFCIVANPFSSGSYPVQLSLTASIAFFLIAFIATHYKVERRMLSVGNEAPKGEVQIPA